MRFKIKNFFDYSFCLKFLDDAQAFISWKWYTWW